MATTKIQVTACDNELLLIASTPAGSSTLCHLKSGYNAPVNYEFNPQHILASGTYDLNIIGLNWGGPGTWNVEVTTDGRTESFGGHSGERFFTDSTSISV